MHEIQKGSYIKFDYLNWKGVYGHREARVISIFFGSTEHHKEEQWLLKAWDLGKQAHRIFAMKDMSNVLLITTTNTKS